MNHEPSSEDRTILAALEALEQGNPWPEAGPGPRDETAETFARLYTEVLGLIPSELDPVIPRPEVKRRLMARITGEAPEGIAGEGPAEAPEAVGEETQDLRDSAPPVAPMAADFPDTRPAQPAAPAAPPLAVAPSAPLPVGGALSHEAGEGGEGGRPPVPFPAGAAAVRPSRRWPATLAAVLAFALLGLSLVLGFANLRQRQTIAHLRSELDDQRRQAQEADLRLRQAESQLHEMRGNLSLVAQYAVEALPLQPVAEQPMFPTARGVLFVAPDHQHWYMSVRGLGPAGEGQTYQLWFVADTATVSGGTFTARPGEQAELSSAEMPAGTRGVLVTLEPGPGSPAPTGPEVLRATNVYPIV